MIFLLCVYSTVWIVQFLTLLQLKHLLHNIIDSTVSGKLKRERIQASNEQIIVNEPPTSLPDWIRISNFVHDVVHNEQAEK